jgi:formylglycine-generating enzyme required for sulfatase activity
LEYAHQSGVIHRDIKPSNLLVDRSGTVKILDMGLARLDAPLGREEATSSERLTASSQVMGTWEYIAPEQALATSKADHRADIYSLGCTLYRLLAGSAPYRGSTMLELFLAHREAPIPSLRDARPDVPEWLEAVYQRMVAKQPDDRYQSMKEVIGELEGYPANPSSAKEFTASAAVTVSRTSPHTKKTSSHRFAILAGTVLGLGLIVLLLLALRPARAPTSASPAPQVSEGHPPSPLGQQPMTKQEAIAWVFLTGGWIFEQGGAAPYASPDQVPTNEPLHKVHLYRNRQIKDEDLARLKCLPPFRELNIEHTAITDAGLVHLIGLKNLQRVVLTGAKVTAEGVERLRAAMPQCQVLWDPPATASSAPQDRIKWEALRELIAWVLKKGGTICEAKALRGLRSPDDATPDMTRFRVAFRHQHFSDEDLARLSQFPDIIDLHLDGTDVTDRGLEHLRKWTLLGCLLLHDTAIGDAGAEQLALVPTILSFGLEGTRITDQGAARIASAHRRMQGIELSRTQISDAALKTLVPCQSLIRLTLAKTKVTDAGLSSLAKLKHLEYLDLTESRVTEAGVARLRQSLPNCKILWKPEPPVSDLLRNGPPPAIAPFDASTARRHQETWAKHLGVPVEMTNSIDLRLVLIPPGEFDMGTDRELMADRISSALASRLVFEGSRPQHRVRITKPFYLGACEVRQIEFQRVMGGNPSDYSPRGAQRDRVAGDNTDQFPVDNLLWSRAQDFCRQLSDRPAERAAGRRYRLPTEAEWEYACRAGSTRRYVFGDTVAAIADYAWPWDYDHRMNHPVGQKKPNPWGLYDMLGNVLEFCADYYDQAYYQQSPTVDPPGASAGPSHVLRGGYYGSVWKGWPDPGPDCRGYASTGSFFDFLGVRIVCEIDDGVLAKASRASKP